MKSRNIQAANAASNQVRIIGGQYRRRILRFPDANGLRPTPDRVRETVFNWLGQELHGLHCLDLFAGSGALGFEAASRGAGRVVMVELAPQARLALQANRDALDATTVEIVAADAMVWLRRNNTRFDIIFLDPPFASDLLGKVLPDLAQHLQAGGYVYLETANWPQQLPGWTLLRQGKAGVVHYGLLQQEREADCPSA